MGSGKGAVYGYRLIADFRRGPEAWERHTLATGYKPLHKLLPGQGSPGTAYAFHISAANSTNTPMESPDVTRQQTSESAVEYPVILVSADDGGWFDLLTRTAPWTYRVT